MSYGHSVSLRGDRAPEESPDLPVLVICRGLPASGKSTWALQWVAEKPNSRTRVNRDDLRQSLFGLDAGLLSREQEKTVSYVQHTIIRALLKNGRGVVCDDTNLRARTVRDLLTTAKQSGADVQFQDFAAPAALCIERDRKRFNAGGRGVGETVIHSFAKRYLRKDQLPAPPTLELEEEIAATVYAPNLGLPSAWLVDMDGTLAKMTGRGPFEWHRVGEDAVSRPVMEVVCALWRSTTIVVVSGRDGSCREQTEQWLFQNDVPYHELLMREAGDTRKDSIVKSEIFWRDIAPKWNVHGVLDDRDQVVRMWRSLGLACFQVAPGNF